MELSYRTLAAGAAYLFTSVTRIQDTGCGCVWSPAKQASTKLRDLQGMPRNASILEGRQHICLPNPVRDPVH